STAATSTPVTAIEATRTPEPDEALVPGGVAPPDLVVASGDAEVTAGVGTYCWAEGGKGLCADAFAPITSTDVLEVDQRAFITAALQRSLHDNAIESVQTNARRIDERKGCDPDHPVSEACGAESVGNTDTVGWPTRLDAGIDLPVSIEGDGVRITPPAEPGTYIVTLWMFFKRGGDVQYGVLLRVRED
ncbi:MAG: hypothetical protein WBD55_03560, partial [Dehalococcoidia bacterium]